MTPPPAIFRRPALWILAPLVLSLLYALAWPLFAPTPTAATVVPEGAVLAHRFQNLDVLDRDFWWQPAPGVPTAAGRPADWIGASRNLPGLPGVDRKGAFHWVLLPREGRPDPTVAIFTLADPDAFRRMFEDPQLLDLGHVRHAQHLEIRGRHAAVAWDPEAVRHLGTAGLTIEDRGEDHAVVADVPGLLRHALLAPTEPPWRAILGALGYGGDKPQVVTEGERAVGMGVAAGRVFRVMDAWRTLRAWFYDRDAKIVAELAPRGAAADPLSAALRKVVESPEEGWTPPGLPPRAKAWLWTPSGEARDALRLALFDAGVDLPAAMPPAPPGAAGGLLAWAEIVPDAVHAWTLGFAAPKGSLVDLSPWVTGWPGGPEGLELPRGAPLTIYDPSSNRPNPAVRAVARSGTLDVAAVGAEAAAVAGAGFPPLTAGLEGAFRPAAPAAGLRLLAAFRLDEPRAAKLLGAELRPRGLFAALAGGEIAGEVWTNGSTIRIDLRRIAP